MKIKNLAILFTLLLFPSLAIAQSGNPFFRNDNLDVAGGQNRTRSVASVSNRGELFILPSGSTSGAPIAYPGQALHVTNDTTEAGTTTTTIVATAHVAKVGDIVQFINTANRFGLSYVKTVPNANSFTIYPALPVVPTNGDLFSIDRPGFPYLDANMSQKTGLYGPNGATAIFAEDALHTSGDNGIPTFSRQVSAFGSSSPAGDYGLQNIDPDGRLLVNVGAPPTAGLTACSAAATGTADTQIVAAVASNKIYVTALSCSNDSVVASVGTFKRGTTAIWTAQISQKSGGAGGPGYNQSFTGVYPSTAVNEALNFAMTTTATSTVCCAAYFLSTN